MKEERIPLLIQIPGMGFLTAITLLCRDWRYTRFPTAGKLVGFAGLSAGVYDSGLTYTTGRITKTGHKNLRKAMVDSANYAIQYHW